MTRLREMDDILLNAQRQGRISFYLTCRGEEAMTIGSASALRDSDVLLSQYREQGLFMWRGFTLDQFTNQVCTWWWDGWDFFFFLYHAVLCSRGRADLSLSVIPLNDFSVWAMI